MAQLDQLIILISGALVTLTVAVEEIFDAYSTEYRQSCILCSLGQPEENEPQYGFRGCADWQPHLGERNDIARDTQGQDYRACSARKS